MQLMKGMAMFSIKIKAVVVVLGMAAMAVAGPASAVRAAERAKAPGAAGDRGPGNRAGGLWAVDSQRGQRWRAFFTWRTPQVRDKEGALNEQAGSQDVLLSRLRHRRRAG